MKITRGQPWHRSKRIHILMPLLNIQFFHFHFPFTSARRYEWIHKLIDYLGFIIVKYILWLLKHHQHHYTNYQHCANQARQRRLKATRTIHRPATLTSSTQEVAATRRCAPAAIKHPETEHHLSTATSNLQHHAHDWHKMRCCWQTFEASCRQTSRRALCTKITHSTEAMAR